MRSPAKAKSSESGGALPPGQTRYSFHLIVSASNLSALALVNLKDFCEKRLPGRYDLKVSNLKDEPKLAKELQIVATPLLIREEPGPQCRFIGSMNQLELALVAHDIQP